MRSGFLFVSMDKLAVILKTLDYGALPLSDYSRSYILRLLPAIDYYMLIYRRCLQRMLEASPKAPAEMTMVDYGGGHGFLSLVAKRCGVGRVIYIDINPQASEAVTAIAAAVGEGPDVVLTGDSATLRRWCGENAVCPDLLLGMDVIEHIYRLEDFFADLYAINPSMPMLFTTGSTPYNPWVRRRLHRIMESDEMIFRQARLDCILEHYPDMFYPIALAWANCTRGLVFDDVLKAVATQKSCVIKDLYNTCDPATGSWTERILPIDDYRRLLAPYGVRLKVRKGFYNAFRGGLKGFASRMFNVLLRLPGTRFMAPFIVLQIHTEPAK